MLSADSNGIKQDLVPQTHVCPVYFEIGPACRCYDFLGQRIDQSCKVISKEIGFEGYIVPDIENPYRVYLQ